jgi:fibronectin type 3 domain-containing protein
LQVERLETRVTPTNYTAYHVDNSRDGVNSAEVILTPQNVGTAGSFGKFYSVPVDGQVYAQPLYVAGVNITTGPNQGLHNVLYVATENDSLYAIDANTGVNLWKDSFINPSAGITPFQVVSVLGVGDINPQVGITSTPVIDPAKGIIYLEAKTQELRKDGEHFVHHLYAVYLANGANIPNSPVTIADSVGDNYVSGPLVPGKGDGSLSSGLLPFDALKQMNRTALTLANNNVYIGFASHGDIGPYHGWILGYNAGTLVPTSVFCTTPNGGLGGIWQSGGGIAVDSQGALYVETGNGTFDGTAGELPQPKADYGDSFLKLVVDPNSTPTNPNANGWGLKLADYFTPADQAALASGDVDLGSGGPILLPLSAGLPGAPHLLVGAGKEGVIYYINCDSMGGYQTGPKMTDNVVLESNPNPSINGTWGSPAYYNGTLFYTDGGGGVSHTFQVQLVKGVNQIVETSVSSDGNSFPGPTPLITSNGTSSGIVWQIEHSSSQLRAYDATNATLGYATEIYNSVNAANNQDALGESIKFSVPTVVDGNVYLGTANSIDFYGLYNYSVAPAAPSNLTATPFADSQVTLAWQDHSNNEQNFDIFRSADGINYAQVGQVPTNTTTFTDTGLTPNTKYFYKVDAVNSTGSSPFTSSVTATTLPPPPPPWSEIDVGTTVAPGGSTYGGGVFTIDGSGAGITGMADSFHYIYQQANGDETIVARITSITGSPNTQAGLMIRPSTLAAGDPFIALLLNPSGSVSYVERQSQGANVDTPATGGTAFPTQPVYLMLQRLGNNYSGSFSPDGKNWTLVGGSANTNIVTDALVGMAVSSDQDGSYASALFDSLNVTPTLPLPASNLVGTPQNGTTVNLTWQNNADNVSGFYVQESTDNKTFNTVETATANATSATVNALTPGATYYFQIVAFNSVGSAAPSNVVTVNMPPLPATPTNLVLNPVLTTEIDLAWTDTTGDETGFKVYRALGQGGTPNLIATVPAVNGTTAYTYQDKNLTPGTDYYYTVYAYSFGGLSGPLQQHATTLTLAPSGVTAVGSIGQIMVSWSAPGGAATYNLYRSTTSGGEGTTPYQSGLTTTSFTDSIATPNTTYYYQVTAVNDAGAESAKSLEVTSTTAPAAPTAVQATGGNGKVTVTWTGPAGGQTFDVYRGNTSGGEGLVPYATGVTGSSFIDSSVAAATTYYYEVSAVNVNGAQGPLSSETSALTLAAAPANLTAQGGSGFVSLSWSASKGATSYSVFRSLTSGGEGNTPVASGLTATSYTDLNVNAGITYFYTVAAVDATGTGPQSAETSTITVASPPANVSAKGGRGQVTISWQASTGASSYDIYRALSSGAEGTTPYMTGVSGVSFVDNAVGAGTTYYYEVSAVDAAGQGSVSSETSALTQAAPPTNLQASGQAGKVTLTWAASTGAATYNLYRAIKSGGEGKTPLVTGLTSASYTDMAVAPGKVYYYEVSAVNTAGESPVSSEAKATTIAAVPSGMVAKGGLNQISVAWNASLGAASYNVYRSLTSGGEGAVPYQTGITTTTFTDVGLASGAKYYYQVTSVDAGGESAKSKQVVAITIPAVPANVTAKQAVNQIKLIWTASVGAASYTVYRGLTSGTEGNTPFATGVLTASFLDSQVVSGTAYFYEVAAVNASGSSARSAEIAATTLTTAPTNLKAVGSTGKVSLTWNAPSGAVTFNVYRSLSSNGEGNVAYITGLSKPSFTDTNLAAGTQYFYKVTAVDAGGESAKSAEANATTITTAPTNVTATGGNGFIILAWSGVSGATSYNIYRGTTPGGEGATPYMANVTDTSLTDTGVTAGGTYYYQITALDVTGESARSAEASATTLPPAPANFAAVAGDLQISLSWAATPGAVTYNLYRSLVAGGEGSTPYKSNLTATSFADTGLKAGTQYFYKVAAVNAAGVSPKSGEASATPYSYHFHLTTSVSSTGAGTAFTVKVSVLDQNNSPVTGYQGTVHFTSSDTNNNHVLPGDYTFTAADAGSHTFSATLVVSGAQTITATDTVFSLIKGTATVTINPGSATHFALVVPGVIGAGTAFNVTVQALDTYGNIASSYTGTVVFTSSDPQAVLPSPYAFVAADQGQHTITNGVTLKTAGNESVTGADTVKTSITGTSPIVVTPGNATQLKFTAPQSVSPGTPFTITVTALDAYGNQAKGYTGTIAFSSSDAGAKLPANYTFTAGDNGAHSFNATLQTAGNQHIHAIDTVFASIVGDAVIDVL